MDTIVRVALGLLGLGIVVFVHELGHFIAARLSGIDVEAFSIGWGSPILKKKIGSVEYRLGFFPAGGYCKMRGDGDYEDFWNNKKKGIEPAPGTMFAASPWKRISTVFAGPLFNFLFAVVVLSVILGRGIEVQTLENTIVLLSDIDGQSYPADQGGLESGDRIIEINGRQISTYRDIQENIALNPSRDLSMSVIRRGETIQLTIHPFMDSTGIGRIGVYPWTRPHIEAVRQDSAAERAGLLPGDMILAVSRSSQIDGETVAETTDVPYTVAFLKIFQNEEMADFILEYERNGTIETAELHNIEIMSGFPNLGIEFPSLRFHTPKLSPPAALAAGTKDAIRTFIVSVRSLALLFNRDIDLTQAISGPARITYMMGDIAAGGFQESIATGFSSALNFLALISIALCLMNLLPIPIVDGGMIIMYLAEIILRKPIHPKAVSIFQTAGVVIIVGLMMFAVFNDIRFFTNR